MVVSFIMQCLLYMFAYCISALPFLIFFFSFLLISVPLALRTNLWQREINEEKCLRSRAVGEMHYEGVTQGISYVKLSLIH